MKRMRSKLLSVVLFVGGAVSASGQAHGTAYSWQTLSPTDAVQAVKDFESNQNLSMTPPAALPPNTPVGLDGSYLLTSGNFTYTLCASTRDVITRSDESYISNLTQPPGNPTLDQNGAQAIAYAFVQSHYSHPEILDQMIATTNFCNDSTLDPTRSIIVSYTFLFYQNVGTADSPITGPSFAKARVDAVQGGVVYYAGSYFPLLINPTPALTGDQAMQAAMTAILVANDGVADSIDELVVSKPDTDGNEHMYYHVTFDGTGVDGPYLLTYVATVDANTGAVFEHSFLTGISHVKARKHKVKLLVRRDMKRVTPPFKPRGLAFRKAHAA